MQLTTLLTTTLATLTVALPSSKRADESLSVQVKIYTGDINNAGTFETYTVPLYSLYVPNPVPSLSNMTVVPGSGVGVDTAAVKCMGYKNTQDLDGDLHAPAGTAPGSATFDLAHPALVATNAVKIGALTCWVGGYDSTNCGGA